MKQTCWVLGLHLWTADWKMLLEDVWVVRPLLLGSAGEHNLAFVPLAFHYLLLGVKPYFAMVI